MKAKPTGHVSLAELCVMLGWVNKLTGEATRADVVRMRRRLRAAEQAHGVTILFGANASGKKQWTTMNALRRAHLIDEPDLSDLVAELEAEVARLSENMNALGRVVATSTKTIARNKQLIAMVASRTGVSATW